MVESLDKGVDTALLIAAGDEEDPSLAPGAAHPLPRRGAVDGSPRNKRISRGGSGVLSTKSEAQLRELLDKSKRLEEQNEVGAPGGGWAAGSGRGVGCTRGGGTRGGSAAVGRGRSDEGGARGGGAKGVSVPRSLAPRFLMCPRHRAAAAAQLMLERLQEAEVREGHLLDQLDALRRQLREFENFKELWMAQANAAARGEKADEKEREAAIAAALSDANLKIATLEALVNRHAARAEQLEAELELLRSKVRAARSPHRARAWPFGFDPRRCSDAEGRRTNAPNPPTRASEHIERGVSIR